MEQLAQAFRDIFEKIVDFFDILDLSFFISGFMALGALWVFATRVDAVRPVIGLFEEVDGGVLRLLIVVLACYLMGLIAFAVGRTLRSRLPRLSLSGEAFAERLTLALQEHGMASGELLRGAKAPLEPDAAIRLYTRLWVELRQHASLAPSYGLVRRYWVLAAICDGVGAALLMWLGVGVHWIIVDAPFGSPHDSVATGVWRVIFVLSVLPAVALIWREARRYGTYQLEEAVATVAWERASREAPGASRSSSEHDDA